MAKLRRKRPVVQTSPAPSRQAPLAGLSVIEAADMDAIIRLVADTPCARAKGSHRN